MRSLLSSCLTWALTSGKLATQASDGQAVLTLLSVKTYSAQHQAHASVQTAIIWTGFSSHACCRFDFSHNGVIEAQKLGEVEGTCRQAVQQEQQVYAKEVSLEEAQKIHGGLSCLWCLHLAGCAAAMLCSGRTGNSLSISSP